MASLTGKSISQIYKDLLHTGNDNTGIASSIKQILCGDGDSTSLYLSTQNFKVQPDTDSTTNSVINDKDGNTLFTVDSTNDIVKVNSTQQIANTATIGFYGEALNVDGSTHLVVPRAVGPATQFTLGTGTDPDTSLTIATTADDVINCMWYTTTGITIDAVNVWTAGHAATGDTIRFHLCSYTIDTSNGSTGGDLSSGVVNASGSDIVTAGYEQAYHQSMTINTATINSGKAVFLTIKGDGSNSDYSVNCQVTYHTT